MYEVKRNVRLRLLTSYFILCLYHCEKKLRFFNRFFVGALAWVILITTLLCIPGDDLPKPGVFDIPGLDKMIHIGLFAIMAVLLCGWQWTKGIPLSKQKQYFILCGLSCLGYGIVMEFVQKYFIPNRSFDLVDIAADGAGSIAGAFFSLWVYKKK